MSSIDGAAAARLLAPERLTLKLTTDAAHDLAKSAVLISAVATTLVFFGTISLAHVGEAAGMSVVAERPLAVVQAATGVSLCAIMLAIPALRGLGRLLVRREVRLLGDAVEILRHTPLGIRRERVLLSSYQGVVHRVHATLSGLTHEIVLAHPRRDLSVTLHAADHVTQGLLDEYKLLFDRGEMADPAS